MQTLRAVVTLCCVPPGDNPQDSRGKVGAHPALRPALTASAVLLVLLFVLQ